MTRTELLAALEAATGPSRELDAEIGIYLGWSRDEVQPWKWWSPDKSVLETFARPRYTASIDAALTLVPEGWALSRIDQYHDDKNPAWGWGVSLRNYLNPSVGRAIGEHRASMTLAVCIAAIRARGEG